MSNTDILERLEDVLSVSSKPRHVQTIRLAIAEIERLRGQGWQAAPKEEEKLDFGDYVEIEMKRYGAPNEFYLHKVVGRLKSSHAAVVPIDHGLDTDSGTDQRHLGEVQDVLNVIQCGVSETSVFKVAVADVRALPQPPRQS